MKISDIFYSLQGEGYNAGRAAIFIRFFGCNLACEFCDEPLHETSFKEMQTETIIEKNSGVSISLRCADRGGAITL